VDAPPGEAAIQLCASATVEFHDAAALDDGAANDLLALRHGRLRVVVDAGLGQEGVDGTGEAGACAVVVSDHGGVVLAEDDDAGRAGKVDAGGIRHPVRVAGGSGSVRQWREATSGRGWGRGFGG